MKSKLSFIVYGPGKPPRYFEIKKGLFRFLVFGLPSVALVCALSTTLMGAYFKQMQNFMLQQAPGGTSDKLELERAELAQKLQVLEREKNQIVEKLNTSVGSSPLASLQLFKPSANRQNLANISPATLAVEEIELRASGQTLEVGFNIVNLTQEGEDSRRIEGFVFVLLHAPGQIGVWPHKALDAQTIHIQFSDGEFFATRRFRPVTASFPSVAAERVALKMLIFNQAGDLILDQLSTHQLR